MPRRSFHFIKKTAIPTPPTPYVPPQDQLVRHWKLDSDTYDSTNKIFTDEVSGITLQDWNSGVSFTTDHNGVSNGAVSNDGTYCLRSLSQTDLVFSNNARSMCFWVKCPSIASEDKFFGYGNHAVNQSYAVDYTTSNGLRGNFYASAAASNYNMSGTSWKWVLTTYDGTNVKFYVDNVLYSTTAKSLNTQIQADSSDYWRALFIMGSSFNPVADQLNGDMDNFMFYAKELSSDDRLDIFTNQ